MLEFQDVRDEELSTTKKRRSHANCNFAVPRTNERKSYSMSSSSTSSSGAFDTNTTVETRSGDDDFLLDADPDPYIPDDVATTLTNFAYPELITQRYFDQLLYFGISNDSDLVAKIGKNMEKEQKYYDEYHRNKKMYTNWFWLHENLDSNLVDYDDGMVKKIKESFKVKYERLEQATKWIIHLSETVNYNKYPINHFMHLLLNEMDSFVYSVPANDLQVNVNNLKGELLTKFRDHCTVLESENLCYDTYDSTLLFDKEDQLHLQKLYYYI